MRGRLEHHGRHAGITRIDRHFRKAVCVCVCVCVRVCVCVCVRACIKINTGVKGVVKDMSLRNASKINLVYNLSATHVLLFYTAPEKHILLPG